MISEPAVAGKSEKPWMHEYCAWLDRVTEQDDFLDDLEPYPPNASVVAGKSIYG